MVAQPVACGKCGNVVGSFDPTALPAVVLLLLPATLKQAEVKCTTCRPLPAKP